MYLVASVCPSVRLWTLSRLRSNRKGLMLTGDATKPSALSPDTCCFAVDEYLETLSVWTSTVTSLFWRPHPPGSVLTKQLTPC